MAIREWQERKETFNPEKNYFDITYENVSRETSAEEDSLERRSDRLNTLGIILGIFFILTALFGGIILGSLKFWVAFCVVFFGSIAGIVISLYVLLGKAQEYEIALENYTKEHDVWNTPEVQEIKRYNKEQNEFAAKWRADHPLEEKIRACLLDRESSVDIANLARYYAEEYLKEYVSRETLD